jgi:hypothetical protein
MINPSTRALAPTLGSEQMLIGLIFVFNACASFPAAVQVMTYSGNDTWDRMLQQVIQLLGRFAQDDRVRIRRPRSTQQVQFTRTLGSGNDFISYVDAIGELDGTPCLLEWKTTSARYPEEPAGISALDSQLVCYSWMTGIEDVAQICINHGATVWR